MHPAPLVLRFRQVGSFLLLRLEGSVVALRAGGIPHQTLEVTRHPRGGILVGAAECRLEAAAEIRTVRRVESHRVVQHIERIARVDRLVFRMRQVLIHIAEDAPGVGRILLAPARPVIAAVVVAQGQLGVAPGLLQLQAEILGAHVGALDRVEAILRRVAGAELAIDLFHGDRHQLEQAGRAGLADRIRIARAFRQHNTLHQARVQPVGSRRLVDDRGEVASDAVHRTPAVLGQRSGPRDIGSESRLGWLGQPRREIPL